MLVLKNIITLFGMASTDCSFGVIGNQNLLWNSSTVNQHLLPASDPGESESAM